MDINTVIADVRSTFGSLSEPDYGAVSRRLREGPDETLVTALRSRFEVDDVTDPNDDHGWHLVLTGNGQRWALRISAVGPYSVLARISEVWVAVLTTSTIDLAPDERWMIGVLTGRHLTLLREDDLEQPVPLLLNGVGDVRAYQALFTVSDILPWDHATLRRLGLIQ